MSNVIYLDFHAARDHLMLTEQVAHPLVASFNPAIAKLVGINAATLYEFIRIHTSCLPPQAYLEMSLKEFETIHFYLSQDKIRTALDKLVKHNLIEKTKKPNSMHRVCAYRINTNGK